MFWENEQKKTYFGTIWFEKYMKCLYVYIQLIWLCATFHFVGDRRNDPSCSSHHPKWPLTSTWLLRKATGMFIWLLWRSCLPMASVSLKVIRILAKCLLRYDAVTTPPPKKKNCSFLPISEWKRAASNKGHIVT